MTTFEFRALDSGGAVQDGRLRAETIERARAVLARRGLMPLDVVAEEAPAAGVSGFRRKIRERDVLSGFRGLATLLQAGLPLDRALAALATLTPPAWGPVIQSVRSRVRGGGSLTEALEDDRLDLPAAVLGIMRAAEAGGTLAEGVARSADLMEAEADLKTAVRSALAYPLLLAVAGASAVTLLVGVVLPRFELILADLGQTLPASTRLVLDAAQVFRLAAIPCLIGAILGGITLRSWTASPGGRRAWHAALLRAPWIRSIRHATATARGCAALSALLGAGCPLPRALRYGGSASGDAEVDARFDRARGRVARGERLAASLESESALTPTAIRLIAAGEHTGRLAEMAGRAGQLEEARARENVERTVRLIEPAMILAFGAVVAIIAAALLQAVYAVRPGV